MTAPTKPQTVNIAALNELGEFVLKTAETPEEPASRLKREEAEDAHKHRISLIVHCFVLGMVTIGLGVSAYVVLKHDPKTGLPDKGMGIITVIISAAFGYLTGKAAK